MPCRSDYLEPNQRESESVKVINFLRNDFGLKIKSPGNYGDVANLDKDTAKLCKLCQKTKIKEKSLELQIWWRDHQEADKKRIQKEIKDKKDKKLKQKALSKLTSYERKLLEKWKQELES